MMKNYFDNAATSLPDQRVLDCAQTFVGLYTNPNKSASDITREMRGYLEGARKKVAEFIHADEDEIAIVQGTTHALGIIANAIPLEKGDNVLICDLEYQASTACWIPRMKKTGAEMREVKSVNGTVTVKEFENALDNHTKAIMLASVQEINGYRCDVKAITDMAHKYGCYVAIDGVQEVGAMKVNVHETNVDFYCAGGKKWIGNPFGSGFLYIRRDVAQKLDPMYYGYFTLKYPSKFKDYVSYLEDPARHPFDDYGIINDATKFEIMGFANYLGAFGLKEAMQVQLDIGQDNIEKHIKMLNHHLIDGLQKLGIKPCSPVDDEHMSSIASFNFGFPEGNIQREKRLVDFMQALGIKVSLRSSTGTGGIRVSMHYYNTIEEIDNFLKELKSFINSDEYKL